MPIPVSSAETGRISQSTVWLLFILSFCVHVLDALMFRFEHSAIRIAVHLLIGLFFISSLVTDGHKKSPTMILMLVSLLLVFMFSGFLAMFGASFVFQSYLEPLAMVMIILVIQSYHTFPLLNRWEYDTGIITTFLLTIFAVPNITNITSFFLDKWAVPISAIVFPLWLYYLVFFEPNATVPPAIRWITVLALLFLFVPTLVTIVNTNYERGQTGITQLEFSLFKARVDESLVQTKALATSFSATMQKSIVNLINGSKNGFNRQIDSATGREFESQVERGVNLDVGVSMVPIKLSQPVVYQDKPVQLLSTLDVKTLELPISLVVYCSATSSDKKQMIFGKLKRSSFMVTNSLLQELVCDFSEGSFKPKSSQTGKIEVVYNFSTSAFVKRFFLKNGLRAQIAEPGVPFENSFYSKYEISDTNTKAIYTKGPVDIAIDIGSPVNELASIGSTSVNDYTLRMQIKNSVMSKGQIDTIRGVLIAIPLGFTLTEPTECTVGALKGTFMYLAQDDCEAEQQDKTNSFYAGLNCAEYNHFVLTIPNGQSVRVDPGKSRQQEMYITCPIRADNPSEILEGNPFSIQSFRARVAYTYVIDQSTSFSVADPVEGSVKITDPVLSTRSFCGTADAYKITPNYDYMFSYSPDFKASMEKAYTTIKSTLTATQLSTLTSASCEVSALAKATILNKWSQVQSNPVIKGASYGYLQTNREMVTYLIKENIITDKTLAELNAMTIEQFDVYMKANEGQYFKFAMMYYQKMADECAASTDRVACIVGKYNCGRTYIPGDRSSCTSIETCRACEETIIPNVITLATQIQSDKYKAAFT
ncbi:MAG TPA: hypothetical protein VK158_04855 [Acidobacteriota bacterium]|nr:hypothetical protein [Acidobacteriota bacterium]